MDIFDIVCEKDRSEANGAFDTTLGREGARFADPDNKWVANYPDAIRLRFATPLRRYNLLCTGKNLLSSSTMQFEKPVNNKFYKLVRGSMRCAHVLSGKTEVKM